MDCRHNFPIISLTLWLDSSNPLLYVFFGVVGALIAGALLVAVQA
jgi:hypothetical protein